MAASFAPRLVLLFMWIIGTRVKLAFNNFIVPLLGLIFLPYTTIMYVLVWSPGIGVYGWDWVWIGLGVVLDVMKWGQIIDKRREIPGYSSVTGQPSQPAASSAPASEAPTEVSEVPEQATMSVEDELEQLVDLRDRGIITDEEYEQKRKQLLGL
jgi:hypothetical protein